MMEKYSYEPRVHGSENAGIAYIRLYCEVRLKMNSWVKRVKSQLILSISL